MRLSGAEAALAALARRLGVHGAFNSRTRVRGLETLETRERQRWRAESEARSNAELDGDLLETHATPDEPGRKLLMQAAEAMRLSARGYTRMLRVARTIADLSGSEGVGRIHVAEALSYRRVAPRS